MGSLWKLRLLKHLRVMSSSVVRNMGNPSEYTDGISPGAMSGCLECTAIFVKGWATRDNWF